MNWAQILAPLIAAAIPEIVKAMPEIIQVVMDAFKGLPNKRQGEIVSQVVDKLTEVS